MSSCIVFQQNQKCYLASDGAVSINFNNENIRIKDDYRKTFQLKDSLIFCSGKMSVVELIVSEIKELECIDVELIKEICKKYFKDKNHLELFLIKYDNKVISYQLSSYNDFEIIERIVDNGQTEVLSIGFNSMNNLDVAFRHIGKHNTVVGVFENVYKEICCPEVGGIVDIFEVSSDGVELLKSVDLNDGYCIYNIINQKEGHLLVADTIVGKLIAGQNLSIGNENNTMVIDNNGITIEGNILTIKGVDGQNKDFNSHFKVLSDEITSKVGKGTEFNQEFGTQFTQTVNAFDFTIGDGNTTNVTINKNGIDIKGGGLTLRNQGGQVIIDGEHNIHKIINEGTARIDFTGQNKTVSVQHNLGRKPAFSAYQMGADGVDQYTPLPAITWSNNGPIGIIRARADNNNLHFDFLVATGHGIPNTTITIKYFIYQEVAF